jgi:hypothetical protein
VAERDVILGMPEPPYIPPRTEPSGSLFFSSGSVTYPPPRNRVRKREKKKNQNFNSLELKSNYCDFYDFDGIWLCATKAYA